MIILCILTIRAARQDPSSLMVSRKLLLICIPDAYERAEMESQAKYFYDQALDALRQRTDVNQHELRECERAVII